MQARILFELQRWHLCEDVVKWIVRWTMLVQASWSSKILHFTIVADIWHYIESPDGFVNWLLLHCATTVYRYIITQLSWTEAVNVMVKTTKFLWAIKSLTWNKFHTFVVGRCFSGSNEIIVGPKIEAEFWNTMAHVSDRWCRGAVLAPSRLQFFHPNSLESRGWLLGTPSLSTEYILVHRNYWRSGTIWERHDFVRRELSHGVERALKEQHESALKKLRLLYSIISRVYAVDGRCSSWWAWLWTTLGSWCSSHS